MSFITTSSSNFEFIFDAALDSYAKQTGIDLTKQQSADKLQNIHSPKDVIQLLLERETAFKDYRDKYHKLIDFLRPIVQVVHAFSGSIGEAAGLAPFHPSKMIFVGLDVLLSAVAGVSASYDTLLELFECVASFLGRLHVYTEKIPLSPTMSDITVKIMVNVLSVLALATKQISQGRFRKFTNKLRGEREIEAVLQRLDRLTQEEAQITTVQTLEVVHGLFNNLEVVMDDGKVSMDGIRQALVEMQEMANEINKINRDMLQEKTRNWLCPPDPSTNHNAARRDHLDGTASWFIQSDTFMEWKAAGSLLWIQGKPGSGKSILCSSIIQEIEGMRDTGLALMTYFYCDFRDRKKQEVSGLLASLVAQLSAKSDACYRILSALYSEYDAGSRLPSDHALIGCLGKMLQVKGQPTIYIIIDAIDECPNGLGLVPPRERVIELVEKLADSNLPNVRICATSRLEADIHTALASLASHSVSLHDEAGQRKDITEYIRSIVHSDRNMRKWRAEDKEMVIDTLSRKAGGMFRWIVCQLEALRWCFPSAICRTLNDLPRSLDETYDRILLGIARERQGYARRLFQCLAVSIRPLRVEELAEVVAIQFDAGALPNYDANWRPENSEEAVLSSCSSLITFVDVDGSQVVQFSHFSVKEYLLSERLADAEQHLSQFHILPCLAHTTLAQTSLSVLLALDNQVDAEIIRNFPLALYAARYWVDHARFDNAFSTIKDAIKCLFDASMPHFVTWTRIYDIDYPFLDITTHPTLPDAFPLYYAILCGFRGLVEHLVVTRPQDINARGGYHSTPLHAAIVKGNIDLTKLLLEHGADITTLNAQGLTPVHEASKRVRLDIVELLLDHQVGVDIPDWGGRTPLAQASFEGELGVAQVLLRYGASVSSEDILGWTPLTLGSLYGHLDVMRLLIKSGAAVDSCTNSGWTPLKIASLYGYLDVVRLLLKSGAAVGSRDNARWTPLMSASQAGHLDIVRLLLQKGAALESRNDSGCTPLTIASGNGQQDVLRLLIRSGATVDLRDNFGWTPLLAALQGGHLDVVRLLLQGGASVGSSDNGDSIPSGDSKLDSQHFRPPLHIACANGYLTMSELLIQHGADVNMLDQDQETPLHLATCRGQLNTTRLLLESGSNVNSQNNEGDTSLHKAVQSGYLNIVTLLCQEGADVTIRNSNDKTPFDLALEDGRVDVARFLVESMGGMDAQNRIDLTLLDSASQNSLPNLSQQSIGRTKGRNVPDEETSLHSASKEGNLEAVQSLLDSGADVNERNRRQETPVLCASIGGSVEIVKLLAEFGADLNSRERFGVTPLLAASRFGYHDVVHFLLAHNADVNSKMQGDWTALHFASRFGHFDIVKTLLRRGADVHARNDEDLTPRQLASRVGKREVVQLLSEYGARGT